MPDARSLRGERPRTFRRPRPPAPGLHDRVLGSLRIEVDALLLEDGAVERPVVAAAGGPLLEDDFGVGVGVGGRPAVDPGEVGQRGGVAAPLRRQAEVLDLVAGGTESDEAHQALHQPGVVVVPHLVTFDRVTPPPTTADLAAVPRRRGRRPAQPLPHRRGHVAAHVRPPAGRRHQLHRQSRHRPDRAPGHGRRQTRASRNDVGRRPWPAGPR